MTPTYPIWTARCPCDSCAEGYPPDARIGGTHGRWIVPPPGFATAHVAFAYVAAMTEARRTNDPAWIAFTQTDVGREWAAQDPRDWIVATMGGWVPA